MAGAVAAAAELSPSHWARQPAGALGAAVGDNMQYSERSNGKDTEQKRISSKRGWAIERAAGGGEGRRGTQRKRER